MHDECDGLQVAFANLKFAFSPPLHLKVKIPLTATVDGHIFGGVGANKNMLGFVDVCELLSV